MGGASAGGGGKGRQPWRYMVQAVARNNGNPASEQKGKAAREREAGTRRARISGPGKN